MLYSFAFFTCQHMLNIVGDMERQLLFFSAVAALCITCSVIELPYILLTQFIFIFNMTINVYYFLNSINYCTL